jgi:2-phospho-L-lactate guanylyltransferase (CobY/MobA/RfbA family)
VARFIIPSRVGGKSRLGDEGLARCMAEDVAAAVRALSEEPLLVTQPGGLGDAVAAALAPLSGPVAIVNGDCPCVAPAELEELVASAPALVAAQDGTTNALALVDARDFVSLYGPGSADRFEAHLQARRLDLPGLRDDVDTWDDLERVRGGVGTHTRAYLQQRDRLRVA